MANTKITELVVASSLDSNTQNTLFVIVDRQSGTPVTKQVTMSVLDTVFDYTTAKANSASIYANGAFIQSNSAYGSQNTTGTYANAAFLHANSAYGSQNTTGVYANVAFLKANTPSDVANSAALYANGAFVQANAAYNATNTSSAGSYANGAFIQANAVYALANINYLPAATRLNVSYTAADAYLFDQYNGNNPTIRVQPGRTIAFDLNYSGANSFMIRQSIGGTNVSTNLIHVSPTGIISLNDEAQGKTSGVLFWKVPEDIVNTDYAYQNNNNLATMRGIIRVEQNIGVVQNIANAGYVQANTPSHTANSAGTYANGAFIQANAAFIAANTPSDVANSAALYANGSFLQANAAFIVANTPTNVANSAALYANGAFIQSNSAFSTANSANTYSAANTTIWSGSAPTTMQAAIDRLANLVYVLSSNTAIP
jgi:hypothetical protein